MDRFYKYFVTIGVLGAIMFLVPMIFEGRPLGGQGQAWVTSGENLVGSSSSLARLASSTAFSDSVAAVNALTGVVDQLVVTERADRVGLNIMARGGTVTSSLFIRQMASQDGTNYFDIENTTSTVYSDRTTMGTSTITNLPLAMQWDPGTGTTTRYIPFETYGFKYTRFLIWGEDIALDTTDGTFVWIQAIKTEPISR